MNGGGNDEGTVFQATVTGLESSLHQFPAYAGDGQNPQGGLINYSSTIYGTTANGGVDYGGVAFALTI